MTASSSSSSSSSYPEPQMFISFDEAEQLGKEFIVHIAYEKGHQAPAGYTSMVQDHYFHARDGWRFASRRRKFFNSGCDCPECVSARHGMRCPEDEVLL